MKTTTKLNTGVTVTRKKATSYCNNSNEKVERIEVQSNYYDDEPMYQQVTIDTEYAIWQKETLNKLLKGD